MRSEAYWGEEPPGLVRAGGLVLSPEGGSIRVAVVHRTRHDDWSFPKGKVDGGESARRAALREVWEETALRCRLTTYLGLVSHGLTDRSAKPTHYWLMAVVGVGDFASGEEIDELRWVELASASRLLTHPRDRWLAWIAAHRAANPGRFRGSWRRLPGRSGRPGRR